MTDDIDALIDETAKECREDFEGALRKSCESIRAQLDALTDATDDDVKPDVEPDEPNTDDEPNTEEQTE